MCVLSLNADQNAIHQQFWGLANIDPEKGQVHIALEVGALWRARGDQRGHVIICRRGVVWITQERDLVDYVLQEGEIFIVTLPGLVLVQAQKPASVTFVAPSVGASPYTGAYRIFR
ncbi:MAG: DUF2917 domain-containing protein [Ardenticatenaceae bacterium]|nr:DUF2917 domain-containing protein [Ardenticatenaceae bacterium]MCB9445796.1 DUF2917 domain-containing protein [Ardenticatenaceae bacterium]